MSDLVIHIYCIKHSFKHLSTRHYEGSFFEVPCYRFTMSGVKGKGMKTSYFCMQDFSILSPKNIEVEGAGGEKHLFVENW